MKAENKNAIEAVDEYYPKVATTGIEGLTADEDTANSAIASIEYYNMNGIKLSAPSKDTNIRKMTWKSGKIIKDKVIK